MAKRTKAQRAEDAFRQAVMEQELDRYSIVKTRPDGSVAYRDEKTRKAYEPVILRLSKR